MKETPKDYSDYRVWKEVELPDTGREYLRESTEYTPKDVYDICAKLIQTGYEKGLEGCFVKFSSESDLYEDWLGSPSVTVCGYRRLNKREVAAMNREDRVDALAKEKGITPYEARSLLALAEKGVVSL